MNKLASDKNVPVLTRLPHRIIIEQTIEWQSSLYLNFIDFQKAFDSIDHQVLWNILGHYGIPPKIISVIKLLYEGFSCQVIHSGTMTAPFPVTTGVRQGCLLSPLLFLIVIDWIGKTAYNEPHGIRWLFISRLEDLEFADDICTLSHRFQDSQHQATRLEETAKRTGLYINSNKTKSMRINANRTDSIQIYNTDLENISNFTYLGSIISTTGGTDEDIHQNPYFQQQRQICSSIWFRNLERNFLHHQVPPSLCK